MLQPRWGKEGVGPQAFAPYSNFPASRGPFFVPKRPHSAGSPDGRQSLGTRSCDQKLGTFSPTPTLRREKRDWKVS